MTAIAVQDVPAGGLGTATFAAAAAGDTITGQPSAGGWATSMTALLVANGAGAAITVTVGALTALSVPAGKTAVIPVAQESIGDTSVAISYSSTTTVTRAAVRLVA